MLLLSDLSPDLSIDKNTFLLPHILSGSQFYFEQSALASALHKGCGVIYASTITDSNLLESIKSQYDFEKKVFLVDFKKPHNHNGLNPFLNLQPSQIAQLFFNIDTEEHAKLTTAFSDHSEPFSPIIVLKVLKQNAVLFTDDPSHYEDICLNIDAIIATNNPFNNTDQSTNVDLSTVINEGHVLLISGLDIYNAHVAEQFKAFFNDYILQPLFIQDQIKQDRKHKTYLISSSYTVLDISFIEKVLAHGRAIQMQGFYTELRTAPNHYESIHKIFANCHHKIKGDRTQLETLDDATDAQKLAKYLKDMQEQTLEVNVAVN